MRIGLFVPCFIDAFFPEVGVATLELLERFGHEVVYPRDQTCCGQPMAADTGFNTEAAATEALFVRDFSGFDCVVAPEGSCVHFVRDNFDAVEQTAAVTEVRARTYELVEFLHDIEKADAFPWAKFPHRVGLHNKCVSLRRLKHAKPSELNEPFFSKPMDLLSKVEGIEFVTPARPDASAFGRATTLCHQAFGSALSRLNRLLCVTPLFLCCYRAAIRGSTALLVYRRDDDIRISVR